MEQAEKELLLQRHAKIIRDAARRSRQKSRESAEDCEQEAMLACWKALDRFDARRGKIEPFLYARAFGAVRDYIRCRSHIFGDLRRVFRCGIKPVFSLSTAAFINDHGEKESFLSLLPDRTTVPSPKSGTVSVEELIGLAHKEDRELLREYWLGGKSMSRIAASVGLSESRICQILNRAMLRLLNSLVLAGIVHPDKISMQEAKRGERCDGASETT